MKQFAILYEPEPGSYIQHGLKTAIDLLKENSLVVLKWNGNYVEVKPGDTPNDVYSRLFPS